MTVVAFDGMPLTYHDPHRPAEKLRHVLLAPAGRAEVIVEGPKRGGAASLRSVCVDTGADGDPNPSMVLADLDTNAKESTPTLYVKAGPYAKATYKPLPNRIRGQLPSLSAHGASSHIAQQLSAQKIRSCSPILPTTPATPCLTRRYAKDWRYSLNSRLSSASSRTSVSTTRLPDFPLGGRVP
jgi:hypothetical protein